MEPSASRQASPVELGASLIRRIRAIDPHAVDAAVALALTVAALVIVIGRIDDGAGAPPDRASGRARGRSSQP